MNALTVAVAESRGEPNPQMLMGRFFHSLIKAVADKIEEGLPRGESLIDAFPRVVQKYGERYPSLNLDYDPFVQRIYDTVCNDIEFGAKHDRKLFVEIEISSEDSLLFGSPDWVKIHDSGLQLIDFKLTTNSDRLLSEKNTAQLAFYSYLIWESYGEFPTGIQLVGLNGAHTNVDISSAVANQIAEDARACQKRISQAPLEHLSLEDLATPGPRVCRHCRYSEICGKAMLGG